MKDVMFLFVYPVTPFILWTFAGVFGVKTLRKCNEHAKGVSGTIAIFALFFGTVLVIFNTLWGGG